MYQHERKDLKELQVTEVPGPDKTASSVIVTEKMRFMNGDNPPVEFQDSTQKGGQEIKSRGVVSTGNKKEVQERLTDLLSGASRVPALLFWSEKYLIAKLNLQEH